ncbi:GNAT family N-acetyltransferase [Lutispora sp.]|uniref:GNAT family N-acetyltransferase n=1 Tax=Lutispora sp. TaxID=2828727 RepID=UPI002B1EFDAB|nr:GNAT family N-acetyltransferase [Lutispora sp.]MEA4961027.1 GNAT family N-acetyltransferase [Lutispora sp.]
MSDFIIRPVRIDDASAINEIRRMDGVRENTLGIISDRITKTEDFIRGLSDNDHLLVAEFEEEGARKVVGLIGMNVSRNPRLRHSASIGLMVHPDYQARGIGTALFEKIIDLADNWLMLTRLELAVFVENQRAVKLYESLGFQIEGIKKYASIKNGKYVDEYMMARYNVI